MLVVLVFSYAPKFRIVEVISYLCGCMTLKYTFEFYETNMGLPFMGSHRVGHD